jgi:hypothetical protein
MVWTPIDLIVDCRQDFEHEIIIQGQHASEKRLHGMWRDVDRRADFHFSPKLSSAQFRHFSLACFDFDDAGSSLHEENV